MKFLIPALLHTPSPLTNRIAALQAQKPHACVSVAPAFCAHMPASSGEQDGGEVDSGGAPRVQTVEGALDWKLGVRSD